MYEQSPIAVALKKRKLYISYRDTLNGVTPFGEISCELSSKRTISKNIFGLIESNCLTVRI